MTQQNDVMEQDTLVSLWADVRSQRQRLAKLVEPTPKKVLSELSDTGLSVIEDVLGYFVQFRQYISESFEDIDGRLTAIEEGQAGFSLDPEAAEMILRLAATCEAFVKLLRDSSTTVSVEAKEKLDEALALVTETRNWVTENVDLDDDDDEDEAEAEEAEASEEAEATAEEG